MLPSGAPSRGPPLRASSSVDPLQRQALRRTPRGASVREVTSGVTRPGDSLEPELQCLAALPCGAANRRFAGSDQSFPGAAGSGSPRSPSLPPQGLPKLQVNRPSASYRPRGQVAYAA